MKTWAEIIRAAGARFKTMGIADPDTNAEYLAASVLGVWKRAEIRPHLEEQPLPHQEKQYEEITGRRALHEPLQYITGETEFFGLRLSCSPAALIPRPETEILVEEALKEAGRFQSGQRPLRILDIGTGSGAIVLALASRLPRAECIGIDISEEALALAEKNRAHLALANVRLLRSDLAHPSAQISGESFDLLVSNPPYISAVDFKELDTEIRGFEPAMALTDRGDGLTFYREIARQAKTLVCPGGAIVVETEYKGAGEVRRIFSERGLHFDRTAIDLLGHERVVVARVPAANS